MDNLAVTRRSTVPGSGPQGVRTLGEPNLTLLDIRVLMSSSDDARFSTGDYVAAMTTYSPQLESHNWVSDLFSFGPQICSLNFINRAAKSSRTILQTCNLT